MLDGRAEVTSLCLAMSQILHGTGCLVSLYEDDMLLFLLRALTFFGADGCQLMRLT
jgi:hypothetical protein